MNKTEIIWILSTASFASTFGVYALIRKIRQCTHTPTNVLRRETQDIELQYNIEPIQSNINARDIDLSSLPIYPRSQVVINHTPIRWNEYNPPRYSELSENIINSPLENENIFNLINNQTIFYSLCTVSICLITGLIIKSYFKPVETHTTPDSPPTFNFTPVQLKELDQIMDKGELLNKETKTKLEEDFSKILGKEETQILDEFNKILQKEEQILDEFNKILQDITEIMDQFLLKGEKF